MEASKQNSCKLCNKVTVKDGLCYLHHVEAKKKEWLDNTDRENLGIVKWAMELLPEFAFNKVPDFHKTLYLELLKLYNPKLRNKYERLLEFISFRESAKSTAANTIFVAYITAHNGDTTYLTIGGKVVGCVIREGAIIIISETAGSAEDFTVRVRDSFAGNEKLRYYYRYTIQEALDSDTGVWTRSAFKINGLFIQGIGSGQMIRGKVKGFSRPSLVIADDIYSENTIITEERRAKTKKWWNNAVMNSIDNLNGKVVVLGTILHEDTVLVELESNPLWKTIKVPVMGSVDKSGEVDLTKFHRFIDKHIKVNWEISRAYLPFDDEENLDEKRRLQKAYFDKVQESYDWELRWPERIDLYLMAIKFQEAVFNQSVDGLYQEYFHITSNPEERRFRKEFFQVVTGYDLKFDYGYNWLRISHHLPNWTMCNVEFGIDIAGTGKDEAVISVIASTSDLRIFVLHQAIGKWSIRDDLLGDKAQMRQRYLVADQGSRNAIRRVGIADECYRLAKRYRPSKIKVGVAAEEEMIAEEIRRVFQSYQDYLTYIMSRPQTRTEGKKEQRIANTLLPFYETRMVYHNTGLSKLEYQLEHLGRTKHDDCADSLECAFFALDYPENLKYESFETSAHEEHYVPHLSAARKLVKQFNIKNNFREYF